MCAVRRVSKIDADVKIKCRNNGQEDGTDANSCVVSLDKGVHDLEQII